MTDRIAVTTPSVGSLLARLLVAIRSGDQRPDPRALNARPQFASYLAIILQFAAATGVVIAFRLEEPRFVGLLGVVLAGFSIHYWLPFRAKEPFVIVLSVGGMLLLLSWWVAAVTLLLGLFIYAVAASPAPYAMRLLVVVGLAGALTWLRTGPGDALGIPAEFWPVIGSIFVFRLIVYFYDLRYMSVRPSLREFLSYFFMLPNFYFLLFPIVDLQTMRKSYYQRDINTMAQTGMHWIVRGIIQLLIYRLIYQYRLLWSADYITNPVMLIREMVLIYLLYLRVSGTFHIIIGIMHLFGFNLPETHRRYLLASSITDFWRRINIYWKDFMVKIVYFPLYFRLRKRGDIQAQVLATGCVFVVTWALHSYQAFWISGQFLLTGPDIAFWSVLGMLVIGNVLLEQRRRKRLPTGPTRTGPLPHLVKGLQIATTFSLITVLWSLWNTPTIAEWLDIITWWRVDW